jgi:molecular chaperone DnaJ
MKKDYYEVLGLDKNATPDEIKKAYKKMARKYHPDINKDENASEMFVEINEANEVLSDPQKKAQYDQFGHAAFDPAAGGAGGGFDGFNFGGNGGDFGIDVEELLNGFFGGGSSRSRQRAQANNGGEDLRMQLNISFEDAFNGVETEISYNRDEKCGKCDGTGSEDKQTETCSTCSGNGYTVQQQRTLFGMAQTQVVCSTCQGKGKVPKVKCTNCKGSGIKKATTTISIKIPAGIDSGQTIRVQGQGNQGLNGTPNGDLLLTVYVQDHEIFERSGNDIYCEMPISIYQATVGGEIEVPTVNGKGKLKIKAGTQTGQRYKIPGKGFKGASQYVITKVIVPSKINKEQEELLKKFDEIAKTQEDSPFYKKIFDHFKKNR